MNTVIGIDPGKTGAMVILYPDNSARAYQVPLIELKGKQQPAWYTWFDLWSVPAQTVSPDLIVIENVAARPKQGVTSMFNFGQTLGFVKAIACSANSRIEHVTPSVWKGKLGLLKSNKGASRELARQLIPSLTPELTRVKDDGVAEAALLAHYGRQHILK